MLGLKGRGIHQSSTGWTPVFVDVGAGTGELGVMSVGFMLPDDDNAVIGVVHEKVALLDNSSPRWTGVSKRGGLPLMSNLLLSGYFAL